MKNLLLLSLLVWALLCSSKHQIFAQEKSASAGNDVLSGAKLRQAWTEDLAGRALPLRTIDPADEDFSDLEPVGQAIGDASIVMLGEQSHGDGGAITSKSRLVKYLHLKKGFDVLAFEADFFSINAGWSELQASKDVRTFAENNIYGFWSDTPVSEPLWRFIEARRDSTRPLEISGIDCRHAGTLAKQELPERLRKVLTEAKPSLLETYRFAAFEAMLKKLLAEEFRFKPDEQDRQNFYKVLDEIAGLIKDSSVSNKSFWNQELVNLRNLAELVFEDKSRDKAMAANLSWLVRERFPGKKIIVWAHNNHNVLDVRMYASFSPSFAKKWYASGTYNYFTYLGADAYREFGAKVFSLGTLSYTGSYSPRFFSRDALWTGDVTAEPLKPPAADSLESVLNQKGMRYGFVSMPKGKQGGPSSFPWFKSRALDLSAELEMDYVSGFNGFIFIEDTFGLSGKKK